jgi:Ca2+-binding EF-hand superfamily protein
MMGPAMMRMMLTLMDTDGDGTVSLSEFQAAHERMFKAMDGDKDGRSPSGTAVKNWVNHS